MQAAYDGCKGPSTLAKNRPQHKNHRRLPSCGEVLLVSKKRRGGLAQIWPGPNTRQKKKATGIAYNTQGHDSKATA